MTDEEKYAIDYLKIYIKRDVMYENRHYKQIEIILNLIEKQSKEIEELNYIKRSFDYCVEQENKKWKDKIKAKIEEVKDGTFDAKIILQSLLEKE